MTVHVAFVLAGLAAGGAERVIEILSRAAIGRGWDVTVVAFDSPASPTFHAFHPAVTLERLDLPPRGGRLAQWRLLAERVIALRRLLRARNFSVVVSFLTKINVLTLLAAAGSGLPVIVAERNNPLQQPAHRLWNLALRFLYPHASQIVLQTERSRGCLPPSQRARAVVLANPMQGAHALHPIAADVPVLNAVGRLTAQKGFDLLLEAFATIVDDVPGWQLVIWGEGPDRPALEAQVSRLRLGGRVRLPGLSSAPGSWCGTGSCFVLSSRYEGFPNALLEAQRARMAVVAFDCEYGPRELIEHRHDGLLVPAGDVAALADALRSIMTDRALRLDLAANAFKRSASERTTSISWLELIGSVAPTHCANA